MECLRPNCVGVTGRPQRFPTRPSRALAEMLRGRLVQPSDPDYDDARAVWNGMVDKHPALIVQCAGVADVITSVNFAKEHDLLVAVRGGGHNAAGNAVCDDGLVIDLSLMKAVRVDPLAQTVRAEGGVTIGDLDHESQVFGLAVPYGRSHRNGNRWFDAGRRHRLAPPQIRT
jgi:FAD/FMN-containing dehydrogenase